MSDFKDEKSVAIEYGDLRTPRVIAKARGEYSAMMREKAKELDIPILRLSLIHI